MKDAPFREDHFLNAFVQFSKVKSFCEMGFCFKKVSRLLSD